MCTIVVLKGLNKQFPLIVAGNRDEDYHRESAPPQRLSDRTGAVGGRDLVRGGTWAGIMPNGFLAALTNQRTKDFKGKWSRSRGHAVLNLLDDPFGAMVEMAKTGYKPFNLIIGLPKKLYACEYRVSPDVTFKSQIIPDGVHVLPNDSLNHPDIPKVARIKSLLEGAEALSALGIVALLERVLADHTLPDPYDVPDPPTDVPCDRETGRAVQSVCVHARTYGTVSSFIWVLDSSGPVLYLHSEGPPCENRYQDYTHLIREY